MRPILFTTILFCMAFSVVFAQTVPAPQPIEQHYGTNYWWWIIGVLLAIGAGVALYMLIKKDPKKDAVR